MPGGGRVGGRTWGRKYAAEDVVFCLHDIKIADEATNSVRPTLFAVIHNACIYLDIAAISTEELKA